MTKTIKLVLLFLGLWICLSITKPQTAMAQASAATSGSVVGTVRDQTGAVILGANITIRNSNISLARSIDVNSEGFFYFAQLPPGEYLVTVTAPNFKDSKEKLILGLGTTALLDTTLQAAGCVDCDVIEVIDSTLLNQGKTESSTNIDSKTITNLPINRRDFIEFALISARVTRDASPSQGVLTTSGLSINGQSARSNNLSIDGLSNNDFGSGANLSPFSQESVQEFQVITNNFSAEIGRTLAGTINIVTKGGSNEFHSNLFAFHRNNDISARNAFSAVNPEFRQSQFGLNFSGPIKKDKAFFFSSFERLLVKQNNILTISNETLEAIKRQGFLQKGGVIPFSVTNTNLFLRTDLNLSSNDTLWIRVNGNSSYNGALEQFGGLVGDTAGGIFRANDNSFVLNNTYFNNNNLVNETRAIFSRLERQTTPIGTQPQVQLVSLEGNVNFGQNPILPQKSRQHLYQIINNTSINYKNQNIKFGVDLFSAKSLSGTLVSQFVDGSYSFSPLDFSALTGISGLPSFSGLEVFDPSLRTPAQKAFLSLLATNPNNVFPGFPKGVPLADLPLPRFFIQGFGDPNISITGSVFSAFLQNDIKIKPNFLLKVGLRYDLTRLTNAPDNNGNFSPRISFSYNPKNLSKLNIAGSYGLFFAAPLGVIAAPVENFKRGFKALNLLFPFSVLPLQLAEKRFSPGTQLPSQVDFIPQLSFVSQIDRNFLASYSQQANVNLNFSIAPSTQLTAEYTFVRGLRLISMRNINPVVRPLLTDPMGSFVNGRVDPSKGTVFNIESAYDSYYNAFTLSIKHRLQNKIALLASYNYSKAIDNANDFSLLLSEVGNSLKPGGERGLSLQDIRNRLVFSGIFDISYNKTAILKNLQLSSIVTLESGRPYNLLAGMDLDLSGDPVPADRPASLGRNVGVLPGFANVDLRLTKGIKFQEKYSLQATLEVFNLFNRVNINEINRIFLPDAQGNFNLPKQENGRFTASSDRFRGSFAPRQFQLGIKVSF
jgi:hypothetical protein